MDAVDVFAVLCQELYYIVTKKLVSWHPGYRTVFQENLDILMCGHVWPCMGMYGKVYLCMVMYGYACLYMVMFDVCSCLILYFRPVREFKQI